MPENSNGNPNNNESSEEQTPPTDELQNPPIDLEYVAQLEARIANQQVEFRKVTKRLESLEERKPPAPPRDLEDENRRYYTNPIPVLDEREKALEERLIGRIEKSLEPIRRVAERISANSEYEDLKFAVARDPAFARAMQDKDVMRVVDRMMSTPGASMDEATLKMAISSTSWAKQHNQLPGVRRAENNNDNGDGRRGEDTAYIPPSNRRRDPPPQERELTEDDKLAMRIGGITDPKEYWELIDSDKLILAPDKGRDRGGKK